MKKSKEKIFVAFLLISVFRTRLIHSCSNILRWNSDKSYFEEVSVNDNMVKENSELMLGIHCQPQEMVKILHNPKNRILPKFKPKKWDEHPCLIFDMYARAYLQTKIRC